MKEHLRLRQQVRRTEGPQSLEGALKCADFETKLSSVIGDTFLTTRKPSRESHKNLKVTTPVKAKSSANNQRTPNAKASKQLKPQVQPKKTVRDIIKEFVRAETVKETSSTQNVQKASPTSHKS